MPHSFKRELEVAINAVREAAGLCRAVQAEITPDVLAKKDKSPVTVADFGSQSLVCRALAEAFPGDPVVAEEDSADLRRAENAAIVEQVVRHVRHTRAVASSNDVCRWIDHGGNRGYAARFWTLDPIDGTKGFLRGEQYAIALALMVNGEIEVAALACPNLPPADASQSVGAIFTAVRGHGATARTLEPNATPVPIHVSSQRDPARARFCESVESGHSSHDHAAQVARRLGITADPARMDSQAKYAVVARGGAEIYLRLPTRADYREKIWDHAAGALVIREAGGTVTDVAGRPLEFTHGAELSANRGVIVTNGSLHEPVLAALKSVGVS
jgi:3'(2'), 5'-bisphosphate nucleotidase